MNEQLRRLVKSGEVIRHRRMAPKGASRPFRTFRLKEGMRLERAAKLCG